MCRSGLDLTPEAAVTEIINLRHLEWFQLASDVSNQRAQYYANVQKFSRNYVERCLRKCIFSPNGQIVEVCIPRAAAGLLLPLPGRGARRLRPQAQLGPPLPLLPQVTLCAADLYSCNSFRKDLIVLQFAFF